MQGKADQPAMKRMTRPRQSSRMDFGVQVYAKPPPLIQDCSQVCFLWHNRALASQTVVCGDK